MMRPIFTLAIGLAVGAAGAILFRESLRPEEGSEAERIELLTREVESAQARIAELEAGPGGRRGRGGFSEAAERARRIAEDLRDGKRVNIDELFAAMKPVYRELAPVFDRIRVRDERRHFERVAGEMAREYGLDERQQDELEAWLHGKAEENAAAFSAVFADEDAGFEELVRAGREMHGTEGIDGFMEGLLDPEMRELYRADRMIDRIESVQAEADRKVERLDSIVDLSEDQKDAAFSLMARGARDFDPSMQFEGLGNDTSALEPGRGLSRDEAIQAILTPEQVDALLLHRTEQMGEAAEELDAIGLELPPDWDLFDFDDF
jgi:hypothetical protein